MARITIKDLPQSDELDREAMRSVLGGALSGPKPRRDDLGEAGRRPIVEFPPGWGGLAPWRPKGLR